MTLFRVLTVSLLGLVAFASTANAEKRLPWEMVDAHYAKVIACKSKTATVNWGKKVVSNGGPHEIGGRKIDATVQYETKRPRFSVGSWTKPFYEPQTGQIVMHLSAVNLRGTTTFRVQGEVFIKDTEGRQLGGTRNALVKPHGSGLATLTIRPKVLRKLDQVVVSVSASDGGRCDTRNFAVYTFKKNAEVPLLVKRVESSPWTGTWKTQWGPIELTQDGNKVTGQYKANKGKQKGQLKGLLKGTVSGTTLKGTWSYAESYKVTHKLGRGGAFEFSIKAPGKKFTGKYGYGQKGWYGKWNGTRAD